MLALIGCGNSNSSTANNSQDTANQNNQTPAAGQDTSTNITGTVVYAVRNYDMETEKKMVEEFNKVYPNITVQVVGFDGDLNEYLSTQAASKTLPDVTYGWENLNYPISQGWVYPLDEFLAKDDEIKNVNAALMNSYKFGGKTYAVPTNYQFSGVMINLDLLEQLNLDVPSYTWTIDEFKNDLVKATTDEYSGINHLSGFDDVMSGVMSKKLHEMAYDPTDGKFKFTEGSWVKAINLQKELKAIPGLVSDDLKNDELRKAGKEDDYQKKFGKDADALREGKVLMGFHGTWDLSWIRTMNYRYDLYPLPQDPAVGYKEAVHADHAFMMSTAKNPQAAFELLKWRSYGTKGILTRLDILKNKVDADGKAAPDFFIPVSNDPEVVSAFKALDYVPEGVKYMFDNVDKGFRADYYKIVPDWDKVMNDIINPECENVRQGKADAAAVAPELEQKANDALAKARQAFDAQLAKVQQNFNSTN